MEQQHRTKLTTISSLVLEQSERQRLYINLALHEYSYLRVPNYNEKLLLEQLKSDFKKYVTELQKLVERDPNNYMLHKINSFIYAHYQHIRVLADECKQAEQVSVIND